MPAWQRTDSVSAVAFGWFLAFGAATCHVASECINRRSQTSCYGRRATSWLRQLQLGGRVSKRAWRPWLCASPHKKRGFLGSHANFEQNFFCKYEEGRYLESQKYSELHSCISCADEKFRKKTVTCTLENTVHEQVSQVGRIGSSNAKWSFCPLLPRLTDFT